MALFDLANELYRIGRAVLEETRDISEETEALSTLREKLPDDLFELKRAVGDLDAASVGLQIDQANRTIELIYGFLDDGIEPDGGES